MFYNHQNDFKLVGFAVSMEKLKEQGFAERIFRASGLDGLAHLLIFTNLRFGEDSSGDRIMNKIMYQPGLVDNPNRFAVGFMLGAAAETGFLGFSIYEAVANKNPTYLITNLAIKTFPRILEYIDRRVNER